MLQASSIWRLMGSGRSTRLAVLLGIVLPAFVATQPVAAQALNCVDLLPMFQQGGSDAQIAEIIGATPNSVAACRAELRRPLAVGPAGAPPVNAAGSPPLNAAGQPPLRAVGPPPSGAVGPPPVGHTIKRLP